MLRYILLTLLVLFVARAFRHLVRGVVAGLSGEGQGGVPSRGTPMVRDPVCGTFLVRERALSIADGRTQIFFCSAECRDLYRARPSTRSGRPEPVEGRPA